METGQSLTDQVADESSAPLRAFALRRSAVVKAAVVAIAAGLLVSAAKAATLSATPLVEGFSALSIDFDDLNDDGRLGYSEITGFSEIGIYDTVLALGQVVEFVDEADSGSFYQGCSYDEGPVLQAWTFESSAISGVQLNYCPQLFAYEITGTDPSVVPLPAGLPLLIAGLGVLGLVRRKSAKPAAT